MFLPADEKGGQRLKGGKCKAYEAGILSEKGILLEPKSILGYFFCEVKAKKIDVISSCG